MEEDFVTPIKDKKTPEEIQKEQASDGTKITNAVYKILDFLPEGDPLKNKAKEKALAILENVTLISSTDGWVSLKSYLSADRAKASVQLLNDIEVLQNYLKVGRHQGWIDNVNFLILTNEYDKIKSKISFPKEVIMLADISYNQIKEGAESVKNKQEFSVKNNQAANIETLAVGQGLVQEEEYSKRQEKILQILSEREKAQVSDFIKELPNITKRTVRRDLDDLLKRSKIVRVGEWNQVFYQIPKLP